MPSFRLSSEAAADVEAIGDYGIATFGLAQALKYHLALESRFELLGQFPGHMMLTRPHCLLVGFLQGEYVNARQ